MTQQLLKVLGRRAYNLSSYVILLYAISVMLGFILALLGKLDPTYVELIGSFSLPALTLLAGSHGTNAVEKYRSNDTSSNITE